MGWNKFKGKKLVTKINSIRKHKKKILLSNPVEHKKRLEGDAAL